MNEEETNKINVQCPVCSAKQDVEVPIRIVKENVKGVATIAINAQCGHSFHIFVDKNFSIRGYQRSDFDVSAAEPIDVAPVQNYSLPGIVKMFGEEPFAYAMHALLLNQKAILIGSDQQILKSLFINFISLFEQELADSVDAIVIMSKKDFELQDPDVFSENLVIDLDFSVIKNNPFKDEKVKIEREILKESQGIKNIDAQKNDFKEKISRIFLYTNVILNFIYQGLDNFKDIKKTMKQKDKNISQNELDLAWSIAHARYTKLLK
ncbi:MAG TPA: hypothetical protein VKM55_21860 [Candidatus Lokiarchaeia archaeon]|nr:hypothetical protein [Candidatus Lokiarchaeia archaeon]